MVIKLLENKEFHNLFRIIDLKEEIKKRIVELRKSRESGNKNSIFEDIDIVATLSHWNKSGNSRNHVGEYRLTFIIKELNKEENLNIKALWLVIDDKKTIENERNRYGRGGGDFFDFGVFGKYKLKKDIDDAYQRIRQAVQNIILGKPKLNLTKKEINYLTEILMGRMKAAMQISPIHTQRCLGVCNNSVKYMRLTKFLEEIGISLEEWRRQRINLFKQGGVLHFGDIYKDEIDEPFQLPNGVTSQAVQFWMYKNKMYKNRVLDLNTLNLLYFSLEEYVVKIKETALELKKEIPIKPIKEIIFQYL